MQNPPRLILAFTTLASCLLLWSAPASAEGEKADPESQIVVTVLKVRSSNGQIGCSLYSKSDGFPMSSEKAVKSLFTKISASKSVCKFDGVMPETYAVSVLHDEDKSGKMNTKSFGRPAEGWGVSNNAPAQRFGPPEYDKAKFKYDGGMKSLSINLTYP